MNKIGLIGRLTKEPTLKYTQGGSAVASITVAVDKRLSKEKKAEMQAKGEQTADFIPVVAWGALAETIANYSDKGCRIGIEGRISTRGYTKDDGTKVYVTEVIAEGIDIIDFKGKQEAYEAPEGFTPTTEDIPF